MSLNHVVRWRLASNSFRLTRDFGRGVLFAAWCGLQMLLTGRVRRHRIYL